DSSLLADLQRSMSLLAFVSYEQGYGPEVVAKAGLDALWAGAMAGIELFGAVPPLPLHEAQVLKTPPSQLRRGMPKYGIVGVATSDREPKTPEFNLRLVLSALLRAINEFNLKHSDQIRKVGILPEDLDLRRIDLDRAAEIIRQVYEGTS